MLSASHDFYKKEAAYDNEIKDKNRQRMGLFVTLLALALVTVVVMLSRRGVAKERKRSDELLANILPAETAQELKNNGVAKAKAHNGVTIVFADIKNFTLIAGSLEPQVLVELLGKYFSEFDSIITSLGLEKIKTIGDAYMFVSGLHGDSKKSALSVVTASVKMISAIEKLEEEMNAKYGVSFSFRIGMHTGKVVSGVVGTVKYAFDIWGNAVNLASRMEENSLPGKINVSEDTYQIIKDVFECESRGKLLVKNGGERGMYFVSNKNA